MKREPSTEKAGDRGKSVRPTGVFKRVADEQRKSGQACALCGRATCDGGKCRSGGSSR